MPWTVVHQASLSMGILQARILEWVAMPSSRGILPTQGSNPGLPHCRQILYCLSHQGNPYETLQSAKSSTQFLKFQEIGVFQLTLKTRRTMNWWVTNIYVWTSLKYFVGSVCTYKTVWLLVDWYSVFPLKKKKKRQMAELGLKEVNIFFPRLFGEKSRSRIQTDSAPGSFSTPHTAV